MYGHKFLILDFTHNVQLVNYFDELISQNDVGNQDFFKCCNRCTFINIIVNDLEILESVLTYFLSVLDQECLQLGCPENEAVLG